MYLIVGLGNPGSTYEYTRHNVGRALLKKLHDQHDFSAWRKSNTAHALVSEGSLSGCEVRLALPETYMNNSGKAVLKLLQGRLPEELIVLHDELDLPIGSFKLSFGKGAAGNKGVASIIEEIQSNQFLRVRIGVGPVSLWGRIKKYTKTGGGFVISALTAGERELLKKITPEIFELLCVIITKGRESAMNIANRK
ncbi:MAG: aminoacyl-tRNA hydrolase [Candidatus Paceibacterota bacterium]